MPDRETKTEIGKKIDREHKHTRKQRQRQKHTYIQPLINTLRTNES